MVLDIIKQFKWVDVLVIILLFRIFYIAIKNGAPTEFFKLSGTIFAIYISLHYFTVLSDFMTTRLNMRDVPLEFLDFLAFVILAIVSYSIFVLVRSVFYHFIHIEAAPKLNRWAGLILGAGRAFLCVGLIIFMLLISSTIYLKKSVEDSYYGRHLIKIATGTYSWLWYAVTSKFMKHEKFNKTILEIQESLAKR